MSNGHKIKYFEASSVTFTAGIVDLKEKTLKNVMNQ